jgi:hypothetical protein
VTPYWQLSGSIFLAAVLGCAAVLVVRCRSRPGIRANADSLFVVGWFAIELAGYFALTPFPAARRVIGLVVVGGILTARVVSRIARRHPSRKPAPWILALSIGAGLVVATIDTLDAFAEKDCAERAARRTSNRQAGSVVWFAGHWGFQYYCERAGMRPVVPGESVLAAGDLLVLPIHPEPNGFHRPHIGRISLQPGDEFATPIAEVIWDDWLSAQTIPNFYGGSDPIVGRRYPRLRVVIYQFTRPWKAGAPQRR